MIFGDGALKLKLVSAGLIAIKRQVLAEAIFQVWILRCSSR
jgi:hypothetical protein